MRIGLTVSTSESQIFINRAYVDYIVGSGFDVVPIVPGMNIDKVISNIDGLLLPGGIDIDPIYYGEDNLYSYNTDPDKDRFERVLFHKCRAIGLPIFGICRGLQLIAREYLLEHGGAEKFLTFYTHISNHAQTSDQKLSRTQAQHFVTYIPDTLYGSGSKEPRALAVNSMHHQCLTADFKTDNITSYKGFRMAAWTNRGIRIEKSNQHEVVCESFRITGWGKSDILAVQWHPEELKDKDLLVNFFIKEKKESLLLSMEV